MQNSSHHLQSTSHKLSTAATEAVAVAVVIHFATLNIFYSYKSLSIKSGTGIQYHERLGYYFSLPPSYVPTLPENTLTPKSYTALQCQFHCMREKRVNNVLHNNSNKFNCIITFLASNIKKVM